MEVNALQVAHSSWGENSRNLKKIKSKERATLLGCASATGMCKLPLTCTHTSAAPDALVLTEVHFQFLFFPI